MEPQLAKATEAAVEKKKKEEASMIQGRPPRRGKPGDYFARRFQSTLRVNGAVVRKPPPSATPTTARPHEKYFLEAFLLSLYKSEPNCE